MRSLFKETLQEIQEGMRGNNEGIPTKIEKLDSYISGTRKGCYYLYGANTGLGKTKLVRDIHMYRVYDYYKTVNNRSYFDVYFVDFSLEISPEENLINGISRRLAEVYDIHIAPSKILGWEKDKINHKEFDLIYSLKEYFEEFESKLSTIDGDIDPSSFDYYCMEHANRFGRFLNESNKEVSITSIQQYKKDWSYKPNNPNQLVILLIDTINLSGDKSDIDDISRFCVLYRNICKFTPIVIQQFNAENTSTDRNRYGVTTPMLRDFEDSKRTTKDANVVLGLYSPIEQQKTEFRGFDISKLRDNYRSLHILKNRNGVKNVVVDLYFDGKISLFKELKLTNENKYTS